MRYESILDLIGNTPLVGIHALSPNPDVRIYAKLEGQNPGGSAKDRIARMMVDLAERDGVLRPGCTILEPSSGNTGIGLALVAKLRGYGLRIVMPDNVSVERRQLLEIFGAEVTLSPGAEGSNGAIRRAQEIAAAEPEYAFLYQYGNPANPLAHYSGTGPEIWADCPEVDVFVAGLGTSGTLMGVGRYLKERNPEVQIVAVEPPAGELVQGLRSLDDGFVPPIFDPDVLDRKTIVRNRESIEWTRRLLDECGVFAGISSGAAVAGAAKVASRMESGTVVTLLPDGGWKYLSSGVWTDDLDVVEERREPHQLLVSPANDIVRAATTLRSGGLVAFPTETVYGLGADAENPDALHRLFAVKGRPTDHPVIVHLGAAPDLDAWAVEVPDVARTLAAAFWPGPLTLVLRAGERVSRVATGGLETVGVRVPDHPVALELLDAFGGGIAAPSANRFGRVSPTTADAVRRELGGDVDEILDGGASVVGVESTIVDCTENVVAVLRPGGVTAEMIETLLGTAPRVGGATRAPGTLPAHYAPDARVQLVSAAELDAVIAHHRQIGDQVGVLGLDDDICTDDPVVTLATVATVDEYARALYSALRAADEMGMDVVVAVPPAETGLGRAVGDRLRRAAADR